MSSRIFPRHFSTPSLVRSQPSRTQLKLKPVFRKAHRRRKASGEPREPGGLGGQRLSLSESRAILLSLKCIRHPFEPKSRADGRKQELEHLQQLAAANNFFHCAHKFLYSAESLRDHPVNQQVPEIVVLGSSNAGKSTLLNALVASRLAARVSQSPGLTALMNAYGVGPPPKAPGQLVSKGSAATPGHGLVVVDTPGYGFKSQAGWGETIVRYLQVRTALRGAVLLLSADKHLSDQDRWVLRMLVEANTRTLVVLTKADKATTTWTQVCRDLAGAVQTELEALHREFGRERHGDVPQIYITAAGMKGLGRLATGAGVSGVRMAMLDMAGFSLRETVTKKPETVAYTGPIVSFDHIPWKESTASIAAGGTSKSSGTKQRYRT